MVGRLASSRLCTGKTRVWNRVGVPPDECTCWEKKRGSRQGSTSWELPLEAQFTRKGRKRTLLMSSVCGTPLLQSAHEPTMIRNVASGMLPGCGQCWHSWARLWSREQVAEKCPPTAPEITAPLQDLVDSPTHGSSVPGRQVTLDILGLHQGSRTRTGREQRRAAPTERMNVIVPSLDPGSFKSLLKIDHAATGNGSRTHRSN